MRANTPLLRALVFGFLVSLPAAPALAEVIELTQGQMRSLVQQQQVLGAEQIVGAAVATYGGTPLDIRGFLSEGRMTYRLLLQRADGSVIEVLLNGQTAQPVAHSSDMGRAVSETANGRSSSGTTGTTAVASSNSSRNSSSNSGSNSNSSSGNASSGNTSGGSTSADSNSGNASSNRSNRNDNASDGGNSSSNTNASDNRSNRNDNASNAGNSNGGNSASNRDNANNNRGNKDNRGNGQGKDKDDD